MKKHILFLSLPLLVLPVLAFADFSLSNSNFQSTLSYVTTSLVLPLFYILDGLAFILFSYGLIKFIIRSDNEEEIKKGKEYMVWGILALFILVSFSAILGLLSNEFFGKSVDINNPTLLPTNLQ